MIFCFQRRSRTKLAECLSKGLPPELRWSRPILSFKRYLIFDDCWSMIMKILKILKIISSDTSSFRYDALPHWFFHFRSAQCHSCSKSLQHQRKPTIQSEPPNSCNFRLQRTKNNGKEVPWKVLAAPWKYMIEAIPLTTYESSIFQGQKSGKKSVNTQKLKQITLENPEKY